MSVLGSDGRDLRVEILTFNWLEARDDVYSPASSSSVSKLFPALAITNGLVANSVLGTLDVSDAFCKCHSSIQDW